MFLPEKTPGGSPSREPQVKPLDAVSQTLLAAGAYIEAHGHSKYVPVLADGSACIAGAIAINSRGGDCYDEAMTRMVRALGFEYKPQVCGWNNAPERTKEEVVAKLRSVALGG